MKKIIIVSFVLLCVGVGHAKEAKPAAAPPVAERYRPKADEFYVYKDRGDRLNNFCPAGWMGDYGSLKFDANSPVDVVKKNTAIKITCTMDRKQDAGWAGIYWQQPCQNWGDKKAPSYDLKPYHKLSFLARGEKGGEMIDKFGMGGITGTTADGDSDQASVEMITLTKDWKKYEIDLSGLDLSQIIGGFVFAVNNDNNDNKPIVFYLDEIKYTK